MARQDDRPRGAERVDPHPWRAALWLGLGVIVAGMLWSLAIWPRIEHARPGFWLPPADVWHPLVAAGQVVDGSIGSIYRPDRYYVAGPLFVLFLAPVEALSKAFGLTEGYPVVLARPSSWLVYGPYGLATAIPLLYAARALATQAGVRSGRLAVQLGTVVLVMAPVGLAFGHYEDVLALTLVMLAAREVLRGRPLASAVMLALAMATKQWAVLALPTLVVAAPPGGRVRSLGVAVAVTAALFAIPLALDWQHASRALFAARTFPQNGAAALWIASGTSSVVGTPVRLGAVAVALLMAWLLRRRARDPGALVAGVGLALLSRFLFEPVVYSYYLGPGLAFLLVHERIRSGRSLRTVVLGTGWLLWFQVWPATWWWWAVTLLLALAVSGRALREVATRRTRALAFAPEPGA